jgi:hypothetical protein
MADAVEVEEGGETLAVTFDDMMRYHGVHSPGGVAIAFKAMQRAFTALSPDPRDGQSWCAPLFVAQARVTASRP